jgi:hypothetical protein
MRRQAGEHVAEQADVGHDDVDDEEHARVQHAQDEQRAEHERERHAARLGPLA